MAETEASDSLSISVELVSSVTDVDPEQWNACAGENNPFLQHSFFEALESSGSACKTEGWEPVHLVAKGEDNEVLGVVPLYRKSHSMGEYVFDQQWASFHRIAGGSMFGRGYYPKLQSCVPFTPATGPRLLVHPKAADRGGEEERLKVMMTLAQGLKAVTDKFGLSSAHVTFLTREEWLAMGRVGFKQRLGVQYHWRNQGYETFDDFLATLKQPKRKNIKQERRRVAQAPVTIKRLRGAEIEPRHWEAFYKFYLNTVEQHWARDYLTEDFFNRLGGSMSDRVLLVVAEENDTGELVAGALNLIGEDCIYGRNWGCSKQYDSLHFECCYYQAIEAAIELGIDRVEAGAQGEHKIRRGYLPTLTYSAHYLADGPGPFVEGIENFLEEERRQIYHTLAVLTIQESPFKGEDVLTDHLASQGVILKDNSIYVEEPRRV